MSYASAASIEELGPREESATGEPYDDGNKVLLQPRAPDPRNVFQIFLCGFTAGLLPPRPPPWPGSIVPVAQAGFETYALSAGLRCKMSVALDRGKCCPLARAEQ